MNRALLCSVLAAALAACTTPNGARPDTSPMPMLTFDTRTYPDLRFRIDAFDVPGASRAEFDATMRRNMAFIRELPGFLGHTIMGAMMQLGVNPKAFDYGTLAKELERWAGSSGAARR